MSVWGWVDGQRGAVHLLERDVAAGRVAHAYLFGGSAGRAPLDCAIAFAAAVTCPHAGCGQCESCRRVRHRAHPDVELIEPAGMQLLVEQVRDVIRSAWRHPIAGSRRVIVVDGADRMNPNAQNAFLKALEEPPASTSIVLVAPAPETLLETVRSRCREVTFRTPLEDEVAQLLVSDGIDPDEARRWARLGGTLERSRMLATDAETRTRRAEVASLVLDPIRDPGEALDRADMLASQAKSVRERVGADHKAAAEEWADWTKETKKAADDRLRREQRRAEQDALEAALDDVASVLRDLALLTADPDAVPLGLDVADALRRRAAELGPGGLPHAVACLDAVATARRRLRVNANVLLAVETVFLALYRHLTAASTGAATSSTM